MSNLQPNSEQAPAAATRKRKLGRICIVVAGILPLLSTTVLPEQFAAVCWGLALLLAIMATLLMSSAQPSQPIAVTDQKTGVILLIGAAIALGVGTVVDAAWAGIIIWLIALCGFIGATYCFNRRRD